MINMLQFQICEITQNYMQYLCAYPQCYFDTNVAIECYECLVHNHKHDRQNLEHIVQLPYIVEQSSQNINLAITKLQSTLIENADLSKTIQDDFKKVQRKIVEVFQKMENIVLTRLESITNKIQATQIELEQLINSFDYTNEFQWRERTIYAISSTENILPNLGILQLKINDIQDILKDMESTIINLDHSTIRLTNKINHNQNQKIQLYKLQYKKQYTPCPNHKENLQEYVCTDCNDRELVCEICMGLRHNLLQYDQYEKQQAKNESSLQKIQENQNKTQRDWDEFINNKNYEFQQTLSETINYQLDQIFKQIFEQSTKDSIMCYELQNHFNKIQLETQVKLQKSFDIFLTDVTQISLKLMDKTMKIDSQQPKVDIDIRICSVMMDEHNQNIGIDQNFKKEELASIFQQDKQYLLGIEDSNNINIFKFLFRLKKSDCSGLCGDGDIILGQFGSYVKFIKIGFLYVLDEIKVNNNLEFKNYSQNQIEDIKYSWQLFQVTSKLMN